MKTIDINGITLRLDNIEAIGDFDYISVTKIIQFDILYQTLNHKIILRVQLKSNHSQKLDDNVRVSAEMSTTITNIKKDIKEAINGRAPEYAWFTPEIIKMMGENLIEFKLFALSTSSGSQLDILM